MCSLAGHALVACPPDCKLPLQVMLITGTVVVFCASALSGHLADRGMPLLWGFAAMVAVGTGVVFAAQAVFALNILAATWVMQVGGSESGGDQRPGASGWGWAWQQSAVACLCSLAGGIPPWPPSDRRSHGVTFLQMAVFVFQGLTMPLMPASAMRLYPATARARCALPLPLPWPAWGLGGAACGAWCMSAVFFSHATDLAPIPCPCCCTAALWRRAAAQCAAPSPQHAIFQ